MPWPRVRAALARLLLVAASAVVAGCSGPMKVDEAGCHLGAASLNELMSKLAFAGVAHDAEQACALVPEGWTFRDKPLRDFGRDLDGNADVRWVSGPAFGTLTEYALTDPDGVELTRVRVLVTADGRYFALLGTEPSG